MDAETRRPAQAEITPETNGRYDLTTNNAAGSAINQAAPAGQIATGDPVIRMQDEPNFSLATILGRTMLTILTEQHGHEAADAFATAITTPTLPGSKARVAQDRAWSLLTARLGKVAGEAA